MNQTPSESAPSISISAKKSVKRKTVGKNRNVQPNNEQVALRAYFIGERRRKLGLPGDETSDWVLAEREISEELKAN